MSNRARIEAVIRYNVDKPMWDPGHILNNIQISWKKTDTPRRYTDLRPNPNVTSVLGSRMSDNRTPSFINLSGLNFVGSGKICSSRSMALVIGWMSESNILWMAH